MRYDDETGKHIAVAGSLLKNLLYMVSPLYHSWHSNAAGIVPAMSKD